MLRFFKVEDRTLKRHQSIGVFVMYIDTGSSMPISPSKSRDLADGNNKILTEWKWFETTVLYIFTYIYRSCFPLRWAKGSSFMQSSLTIFNIYIVIFNYVQNYKPKWTGIKTEIIIAYIVCNIGLLLQLFRGSSWSCSCGSWIHNYLCHQCLSLWVWTPSWQGVFDTTLCDKVRLWLEAG